ncbi:hypothetical protein SAY86_030381 [Trapa natans]|uniref:Heparan-alpha-glucosaminide N-acetyltransferase catalytic domain-containing protein n=1 Tax=Trapa natans TaxID=22666 RepID=A0AAN7MM23_TRANT|nr:hypothetical protein SAY86_030381 [Trapa natans]
MADYLSLPDVEDPPATVRKSSRIASIDVFRGLCVFLMMVVDYVGQVFTGIAHSPWNGLRLADFVMPFFLFIAGVSLALVYKKVTNRVEATHKSALRAVKLFFLGVLLQGGYFHGINSLTYGVDIERIRWFGILQRISIGYLIAALCEIWLTRRTHSEVAVLKSYHWHWFLATFLSVVYLCLLYGLYVPDWQFEALSSAEATSSTLYTVECSSRGDLGPACNSAVMIDRHIVGIGHLYMKPVYRNLKVCNMSTSGLFDQNSPSWCHAPFDPEGILSSLTAAVTCVIGLQYGHILTNVEVRVQYLLSASVVFTGIDLLVKNLSFTVVTLSGPLGETTWLALAFSFTTYPGSIPCHSRNSSKQVLVFGQLHVDHHFICWFFAMCSISVGRHPGFQAFHCSPGLDGKAFSLHFCFCIF